MAIPIDEIVIGGYYQTAGDQLRRVESFCEDAKKRKCVRYVVKGMHVPRELTWAGTGTKARPTQVTTFAKSCSARLTLSEIDDLRADGILFPNE
jgi:hypothetical protein